MSDLTPSEMRFLRAFRALDQKAHIFISDLTYDLAAERKAEKPCLRLIHPQKSEAAATKKEAQA